MFLQRLAKARRLKKLTTFFTKQICKSENLASSCPGTTPLISSGQFTKISAWSFLLANLKIFQANLYCLGLTINGMRKELIFVNNYGQKIPIFTSTAGKKKITIHDQNFCNMGSERSNVAIYMVFWEDSIFVDVFIADLLNCNRVSCSKIRENNFETMATSTYMTLKNSLYSRLTKELAMT